MDQLIRRIRPTFQTGGVSNPALQNTVRERATVALSPGLWDSSCAGHVDAGEDYDAAAVRELREELGIRVAATPERWRRIEARDETGWEFCWVYRLQHDGPFVLHPEEIETGEWLTTDELSRRLATRPEDFCPAFKLIWSLVGGK